PQPRWRACAMRAMRAAAEGRFEEAAELEEQARALSQRAGDPNAPRSLSFLRAGRLRLEGRIDEELRVTAELARGAGSDLLGWIARAAHASALARAGRIDEARALIGTLELERVLATGDLSLLESLVDYALAANDRALADRLAALLEPRRERLASWGLLGLTIGAPVAALLARIADARGDRAAARALFDEARRRAGGLRAHLDAIAAHERSAAAAPEPRRGPPRIRMEGGVWIVEHDGERAIVKDNKAMRMLARLVAEPGRELHALDLAGALDAGDAGEAIDAEAREAYRARVRALRDEIEEASAWNDAGRRERAEAELAAIEAELARALGLGGRARRAGAAVERARVNVQRRLRAAIDRIAEACPGLGRPLSRSVRTGTYCSYEP
ncbi:MAG TPA: hypothetical protein VIL20_23800, partial [Sandaracinaceae bacterium]